jgi:predicted lipid-binding transport protein (Tim44 family)
MPYYLEGPPGNPFTRLLAGLVGVLALAGAVFFGLFLFAAAIAVGLVAWAVIWLRVWWIRRRLGSAGPAGRSDQTFRAGADSGRAPDDSVIDGEFEVVSRDERED